MKGLQTIQIDGVSFHLNEHHDFTWLKALGEVFSVFPEQDSGNICFGILKNGRKKFVKYAGARTTEYKGNPEDAVVNLRRSVLNYEELNHPNLVTLLNHFEVDNGYALVFEWVDGECIHPHWSFPPPLKYTHPDSPFYRFKQLPVELRLKSLNCIYAFHQNVAKQNYVAVDFYDGSIIYDFKRDTTTICDIDLYSNKPFINTMGRMWGSSRFMSPEEFEQGTEIDEKTNVFNMGATAFVLLGGELDRSFSKWDTSKELYQIALKAIEKDKNDRFTTIEDFFQAWEEACGKVFS